MALSPTSSRSAASSGAITQITDTTVGAGGVASVTFSAIPATYTTLIVVAYVRSVVAAVGDNLYVQANGDTGANYDWQQIEGLGTTAASAENFADVRVLVAAVPGASGPATTFAPARLELPNYANAVGHKTMTANSGQKRGTAAAGNNMFAMQVNGWWRNTAAITSLLFFCSGGNLAQSSRFTLYGLT